MDTVDSAVSQRTLAAHTRRPQGMPLDCTNEKFEEYLKQRHLVRKDRIAEQRVCIASLCIASVLIFIHFCIHFINYYSYQ